MRPAKQNRLESYIPDKLYAPVEQDQLSERTKIVTEIAVRLLDLRDEELLAPVRLMDGLLRLYRSNAEVMWDIVKILAGNSTAGVSLEEQAKAQSCSKQNIHQTQMRNLKKIAQQHPEVTTVLRQILGRKPTPSQPTQTTQKGKSKTRQKDK